jgi:hypothetical protein
MTDRRVFIQFRASTTIGIASEILRLALVRAALFSETVVPVRVGWLFWRTRSKYPHCIYDAIAAPRIAKGLGLSFRWMQLKALLAQAIDAARIRHAIFRKLAPPTVPLGQEGLYFHNAEMYRRLLAGNLHPAALRKVAHAVRDFGPVSLQRKCAAICAAGLERLGIGSDEWYVCLHVRTSAFHGDKADYRNARFQNYQKVIEHIIALGGKVIRLGDRGADIVTCPQPGGTD